MRKVYEIDEPKLLVHRPQTIMVAHSKKAFPMKISELPGKQRAFARSMRPALAKAAESYDPLEMVSMVMAAVAEHLPVDRNPQTNLARAMARGNVAREELKCSEGGSFSAEQAGARLDISKAGILKRF